MPSSTLPGVWYAASRDLPVPPDRRSIVRKAVATLTDPGVVAAVMTVDTIQRISARYTALAAALLPGEVDLVGRTILPCSAGHLTCR
jgi:hypothetical protein